MLVNFSLALFIKVLLIKKGCKQVSKTLFLTPEITMIKIYLVNYEIFFYVRTTTTVIKNDLKYTPMAEGNTCIAEPNLKVLPLRYFGCTQPTFTCSKLRVETGKRYVEFAES